VGRLGRSKDWQDFGPTVRDAGASGMRETPEMRKVESTTEAVSKGAQECLDMIEQDRWEPGPEQDGVGETVAKSRT
jgi:hypothetical protein